MDVNQFSALVPLYDLTIQALPAGGGTQLMPVTGSVGASGSALYGYVTANTLPGATSQLPNGVVAEGLIAQVQSPIIRNNTTGVLSYPDLGWWPVVDDSNDLQKYLYFDGSYGTNMMPPGAQLVGGKGYIVPLGISLRRLLNEAKAGRGRNNMALLATGIKYVSNFALKALSQAGFPGTGYTVVQPARIRIWGERYTSAILGPLAGFYNGQFDRTDMRRQLAGLPDVVGVQAGQVAADASFATLPGGYDQKSGAQVNRYFNFSSNAKATTPNTAYNLTNSQAAGGGQGQVALTNDLGFPFGSTNGSAANVKDALIVQQFGVAGGVANIAYAGFQIGGSLIPEGQGWPVDSLVDDLAYGNTAPQRTGTGLWYPLPALEGDLVIAGENAAVFIQDNGASGGIPQNAATVAVGGVRVKM